MCRYHLISVCRYHLVSDEQHLLELVQEVTARAESANTVLPVQWRDLQAACLGARQVTCRPPA